MSALGWVQLLCNALFLFLILLLFLGRGWKRGSTMSASAEEQDSYRSMVSALSELIRGLKETSSEIQDRLMEKEAELNGVISAADERVRALKELESRSMPARRMPVARSDHPADDVFAPIPSPSEGAELSLASPQAKPPVRPMPATTQPGVARRGERPGEPARPAPAHPQPGTGETGASSEEERRTKYRQVLEFMEKGWGVLDIARFTGLPRGEVELLMRTKGRQ